MFRRVSAVLGIGLGGFLAWWVFQSAVWHEVLDGIKDVPLQIAGLAVGAVLFSSFLEALRWKLLLPKGERVSMARLFLVRNAGQGLNNVSPVRVFSEVAQTAMLRYGDNIGADKVISSLIVARLIDFLVTISLVGIGLLFLPQLAAFKTTLAVLWACAVITLLALMLGGHRLQQVRAAGRFSFVRALLHALGSVATRHHVLLASLAITVVAWLAIGTAAWLIAQAVGIDLPFWLMAIVIVTVTLFSSAAPGVLPGAVGVYEFAAVSTLGLLTIDPTPALTFALAIHAVLYLPPIVICAVVLAMDRRTMRRIWATIAAQLRTALHGFRLRPA